MVHRLNLHQIVRLREIFRKWRQLTVKSRSLSADSSSAPGSRSGPPPAALPRVPPGHLAVYVGPERERFVIKTSLLAHPLFKALLKKTEAEIGFRYEGGLTIPCSISAFRSLLHLMQGKRPSHEPMPRTVVLHTQLEHHDRFDGVCDSNGGELQLLLQELHRLQLRDTASQSGMRCVPDVRLNPLADGALREAIYG